MEARLIWGRYWTSASSQQGLFPLADGKIKWFPFLNEFWVPFNSQFPSHSYFPNSWSFIWCTHFFIFSKIHRNASADYGTLLLYNFLFSRILLCNCQLLPTPWTLISISTQKTTMSYLEGLSLLPVQECAPRQKARVVIRLNSFVSLQGSWTYDFCCLIVGS